MDATLKIGNKLSEIIWCVREPKGGINSMNLTNNNTYQIVVILQVLAHQTWTVAGILLHESGYHSPVKD